MLKLASIFLFVVCATAYADDLQTQRAALTYAESPNPVGENDSLRDRNPLDQGNDNCPATVISYLPYTDFGTTVGRANNFTCASNSSPDVIYQLTPTLTDVYRIALCGSLYDTRLEVRFGGGCPGSSSAVCNDDACGLQSEVFIFLTAGVTYFIIVDGWSNNSGIYRLDVEYTCVDQYPAMVQECPEVQDTFHVAVDCNGGPCNVTWGGTATYQTLSCGQTLRGRAFTTINPAGFNSRDTDWYRFTVAAPCTAVFEMIGEFEVSMQSTTFPPTCDFYPNYTFGPACSTHTLTMICPAAGDYVLFCAFNGFSGLESPKDYFLRIQCATPCQPADSLVIYPITDLPGFLQLSWVNPSNALARIYASTSTTSVFPSGYIQVLYANVAAGRNYSGALSSANVYLRFVVTLENCTP